MRIYYINKGCGRKGEGAHISNLTKTPLKACRRVRAVVCVLSCPLPSRYVPLLEEYAYQPKTVAMVESFDTCRDLPSDHPSLARGGAMYNFCCAAPFPYAAHGAAVCAPR